MSNKIAEAARRIFGNLPPSSVRSGNKFLRKNMIGHKIAEYYPQTTAPDLARLAEKQIPGVMMDRQKEWRQWKREMDRSRGVTRAKKGQGKRAK